MAGSSELLPRPRSRLPGGLQLGLFDHEPSELQRAIDDLEIEATTPMEALCVLAQLKELRERES